ncbi:hypothetical protein CRUP_034144 [Coryphaenoides rupestris]|nr:hypothetical protein CRUP_034144 [Coryphaenoides rupestris]
MHGKNKKASSRSSRSSAGLPSPDYPTLPLTVSSETLQRGGEGAGQQHASKFPRDLFPKPSLKGFTLLGNLRKAPCKSAPCALASRSCEDLGGPSSATTASAGPWKRSRSLGTLRWEPRGEQQKGLGGELKSPSAGSRSGGSGGGSPVKPPKDRASPARLATPPPVSPKRWAERPPLPSQLPLRPPCPTPASPVSTSPPELLSIAAVTPGPPEAGSPSAPERIAALRAHSKKPPVPPPVPAKNEEAGSPSVARPPWMSDLGCKVAVSRKASHSKMSPDLLTLLEQRLEAEGHGRCGLPPALVQRYSEDLEQPVQQVASSLDQLRVKELRKQHRMAIPSGGLTELSRKPPSPCPSPGGVGVGSVSDWLVSIGLPMYGAALMAAGYPTPARVAQLTEAELRAAGVRDERHVRRLAREARALADTVGQS